ncbi:phosphatase PAP2 family protein [Azorhizobium oxalatiphilum]|uniref:Phosphatase PAP2 family protein n=1 Tax=Azorhizobium oxalatiphilum TaxID=980631 RepID=A0A917BL77_9HYPH|nr:phosphatase PAP2 family protein [Azorhizobium oxalatiphilum]GGF48651.1 phosphatase PAP2 family protein [Azorhizobium oxalatiphilum]
MRWLVFLTLIAGATVAILFTLFPALDLTITAWFWDAAHKTFPIGATTWGKTLRQAGNIIPWVICAPAFAALVLKLLFPGKPMFMPSRAALLLALAMALGPGLLVNSVLKEHWGRPRPVHVEEFNGKLAFTPWYSTDGTCPGNCSFVSGEGALGFWMVAPASLVTGPLQPVALGAAVLFGLAAGGLRIAFGGHFFTDTLFSGVLVILLIVALRWWLFERRGAPTDAQAEAAVARTGRALHRLVALGGRGIAHGARAAARAAALVGRMIARYLPRRGAGL